MKITTQTITYINRHYGSTDSNLDDVDEVVHRLGAQLAAVEETVNFGKKFEDVVIVKVVSCEDHPNADRLHVCKVDDGGKTPNIDRDENGLIQIVCGAPNVHAGMFAAWLPPGSTVPSTAASDPFVLEAREIRGTVSNGMMASPKELAIGDSHEGILEITEELGPITPGTAFADYYHLRGDTVIDMENKMFTHRPDCFGWIGIAREIEGIYHRPYKSPDWYRMTPDFPAAEGQQLPLEVRNELPELVPRFTAIAIRDVTVGPSPVWLQLDLAKHGLRSINNIVDYTNHYMLFTGQPLHAYDYDKVKALSEGDKATIVVRHPGQGEKLTLLNGKEIEPRAEAIMIATDKELIGVGGVMGGADTEVDENTKNIIIESANFDMYSIRRTSMAHGLFTDAVTRFNKGQSPLQNLAALAKMVGQVCQHDGGKVASPLIDINHVSAEATERGNIHSPVTVSTQFVNERLGWNLSADEMRGLLTNVEMKVDVDGDNLTVTAPFWRTDIEIPEDVVEEIGRLNGYDKLPLDLPRRDLTPASKNRLLELKKEIRTILAGAGANEVLTYSFVHGNLLSKAGLKPEQAYQLSNALSPDLQYYRMSLVPSLLDCVHPNNKAGHQKFLLFEMGKAHTKVAPPDAEGLPVEHDRLAGVFADDGKTAAGAAFYQARQYVQLLADRLGIEVVLAPMASNPDFPVTAPFDHTRSAVVTVAGQGPEAIVGIVGEFKPAVQRGFKLPRRTAGFELGLDHLLEYRGSRAKYQTSPRFPKVEQDICLKVPAETPYSAVYDFVVAQLHTNRPDKTFHTLSPVDIYQREDEQDYKQITLRLSIASFECTLTDQEVNTLLDQIAAAAKTELHAERI